MCVLILQENMIQNSLTFVTSIVSAGKPRISPVLSNGIFGYLQKHGLIEVKASLTEKGRWVATAYSLHISFFTLSALADFYCMQKATGFAVQWSDSSYTIHQNILQINVNESVKNEICKLYAVATHLPFSVSDAFTSIRPCFCKYPKIPLLKTGEILGFPADTIDVRKSSCFESYFPAKLERTCFLIFTGIRSMI